MSHHGRLQRLQAVFRQVSEVCLHRGLRLGGILRADRPDDGDVVLDAGFADLGRSLQPEPLTGPCGDYRFIDTDPSLAGGVSFRLCQDAE